MHQKILRKSFFEAPTLTVAKNLLGKYLVRRYRSKIISQMITEVEAYDGFHDKASHAHKGKTKRNKAMFGHAGYFYIYLVYGMHWMLNIVTGKKDYPAAVLIRGVKSINSPAKVTKKFKIGKYFNNKKAIPKNFLWFEDRDIKIENKNIKRKPRVGIDYAGKIWAKKPYRFMLNDSY